MPSRENVIIVNTAKRMTETFDLWSNFVTTHQRLNMFNVFNADFAAPKFGHSNIFATLSLSLSHMR